MGKHLLRGCLFGCLALAGMPVGRAGPVAEARPGLFLARVEAPEGASVVGSDVCLDCHEEIGDSFLGSPHHPRFESTARANGAGRCEACHGPGSLHVDAEGDGPIIGKAALGALGPDERAEMCLQCHADKRQAWYQSDHASTGADCAACHTDQTHFGGEARPPADFRIPGEFCLQCHQTEVMEFRMQYHHPVLEGEMGCTDCHAPHGEVEGLVRFNDENRSCLRCHSDAGGPFVFEHEAVASDACITCHRPHGSPNDRMLTADDNSLCMRCHYEPEFPTIGDTDHTDYLSRRARCYDCHGEIHGSDMDEYFLKP